MDGVRKNIIKSFFVFYFIVNFPSESSSDVTDGFQLRSILLDSASYDPLHRPRKNSTEKVEVSFRLLIVNVVEYSEIEAKFSQAVAIYLNWIDEYLTWNASNYNGQTSIIVKGKEIWTPNLRVVNARESEFIYEDMQNNLMRVQHNGKVSAEITGILSIMCTYKPSQFPFDCQECPVLFSTRTYNSEEVYTRLEDNGILFTESAKTSNPMWTVDNVSSITTYTPSTGNLETIYFKLKRKPLFYILNLIIPNTLLSVLILVLYFIPNGQGEKISFGITIFLTYMVFLIQIGDTIPRTSDSSTAIGIYFILLMVSSCLGIINSVILSLVSKKIDPSAKVWPLKEESVIGDKTMTKRLFPKMLQNMYGNNLLKLIEWIFMIISLVFIITANSVIIQTYLTPVCE